MASNNPSTNSANHGGAANTPAVSQPPLTEVIRRESEPGVVEGSFGSGSPDSSENDGAGSSAGGNAGKKPVWNKPVNGSGPVIETSMWPALGESAKGNASKSFPDLSDGSASSSSGSQRFGGAATSQKHGGYSSNNNATPNPVPARQRLMRRNGSNSSFNGGFQHQHMSARPSSSTPIPPNNHSPRSHSQRSGFASQSHGGHDHSQQRNANRNRNGGSHSRGDGSHYHNYESRNGQNSGNQDWGSHQNFDGRGAQMQQPQRGPPRFIRPSSTPPAMSAPLMPLPVRPFATPLPYPGLLPHMYYAPVYQDMRGVQYATSYAPHPIYMGPTDRQLPQKIVNQIDYYFSTDNLCKDMYLRQNMDRQGWVSIGLIAGFRKVKELSSDVQFIANALQLSTNVEVQGDMVRTRNDWGKWVIPPLQSSEVPAPQSHGANSQEMLLNEIQNVSLEDRNAAMEQPQSSFQHGESSGSGEINTHPTKSRS